MFFSQKQSETNDEFGVLPLKNWKKILEVSPISCFDVLMTADGRSSAGFSQLVGSGPAQDSAGKSGASAGKIVEL